MTDTTKSFSIKVKLGIVAGLFYIYNHFVSHLPIYLIRHIYLKYILKIRIGKNTAIHMGCFFTGNKISIGKNSVINRRCYVDGRVGISIGNNVSISPETWILSLTHDVNDENFKPIGKTVNISDYVWIGAKAIILPGVNLSKGVVVGAGSVVTKSFGENSIIGGIPSKILGIRKILNYTYELKYFPLFDTDITL